MNLFVALRSSLSAIKLNRKEQEKLRLRREILITKSSNNQINSLIYVIQRSSFSAVKLNRKEQEKLRLHKGILIIKSPNQLIILRNSAVK